jgi:hypothetical protein
MGYIRTKGSWLNVSLYPDYPQPLDMVERLREKSEVSFGADLASHDWENRVDRTTAFTCTGMTAICR